MTATHGPFGSRSVHYGWIILAAGTFGSFMTVPGQTTGVSVFFDPITADLGISRTSASIAYAAGTLAGILPAPVIGRWIDRRGPRLTAAIIAGGLALACVVMAAIHNGIMLLVGFALLRGAAIGGRIVVSQQVGENLWFAHRRGIAAAAASLGLAAGSMVFPQAIELFISAWGWRGAYLVLAALVAATMLPVAALLYRDRPEKFGLNDRRRAAASRRQKAGRRTVIYARPIAATARLAAMRRRVSHQCDWHRAAAQPLLDHAISRRRSSRCTRLLSALAGIQAAATLSTGALLDRYEPLMLVPVAMFLLAATGASCLWQRHRRELALRAVPRWGLRIAASDNAAGYTQYLAAIISARSGVRRSFLASAAAVGALPFAASMD